MKRFLGKRWFLLLLLGGLMLAWFGPAWLRQLTSWLDPRVIVGCALLLMSLCLESRRLYDALRRPWPALWALAISYGLLPALACSVGPLLSDSGLRVGLLISASVPCTLASAVIWTRMGSGNEATALLVTLLTTATSWLATTAWLVGGTGAEVSVDARRMIADLFLVLIVPVGLGQGARAIPAVASVAIRFKTVLSVLARLLIFSIILKAAVEVFDRLREPEVTPSLGALLSAAALCVGLHLTALLCGLWSSKALGFDRPNQIAVAFSCSQKTLPVGLFVFTAYFEKSYPLAVVPLVIYHVSQLVLDTFIAESLAARAPAAGPGGQPVL